ncbi:MAG: hypothetical protein CMI35_01430, partial [Owenweeksia sp.]|nr:hypothetical protein [Owenweeksia sp.]
VILLGEQAGLQVIPLTENKYLNRTLPTNQSGNLIPRTDNFTPANQYVIIRERGEIQVSSGTSENLVLYYITDQTRLTINTVIHPYLIDTIKKYMDWSYERDRIRPLARRVAEAKQEYREALMILRGRKNRLSKKKILQLISQNKFYGLR